MNEEINPFEGIEEGATPPPTKQTKKGKKIKTAPPPKISIKLEEPKAQKKKADDPKQKAKLIYAIQAYGKNARLGPYLENECNHNFNHSYLKGLTIEDLKLELEKQDVALANKQNHGLIDTGIKNGMLMAETLITSRSSYKINGTTEALYEDDHYHDLVERVKMKYNAPFMKLDPVLELALVIGQTAMIMHHKNSMMIRSTTDLEENIEGFD